LKKVAPGHNPDQSIPAHHRQALDVMLVHGSHDLSERCIFRYGDGIRSHDLSQLAPAFMHEVGRDPARANQEPQPPAALSLRPDFRTANEIALRNDADQLARRVDDRQSADVMLQHCFRRLDDGRFGANRDDLTGHDVMGAHGVAPTPEIDGQLLKAKAAPWLDRDQPETVTEKCSFRSIQDGASAQELPVARFGLHESRLQWRIGQADRRPEMGRQERPRPREPHLRNVNRGLKASNDQNHEKGFDRFICHGVTHYSHSRL
jgi:hypothetical protein